MPPKSPVISRPCNPDRFYGAAGFLAQIGKLLNILGLSADERHHTVVVAAPGSSKTPLGWMDPFKILCVVLMERRIGGGGGKRSCSCLFHTLKVSLRTRFAWLDK